MFLVEILTIAEKALQQVFIPEYTTLDGQVDFSSLHISIEYPISPQNYPGIWVNFELDGDLTRSGIDNAFTYLPQGNGTFTPLYLWRGQGWITYTVTALTSLQNARLYDELVRVIAFNADPQVNPYRSFIEENPLIAMNVNFDNIAQRSDAATPGTPWGTDEIIYERTIAVYALAEFYTTNTSNQIIPFNQIEVIGTDPAGNTRFWENNNGVQSAN